MSVLLATTSEDNIGVPLNGPRGMRANIGSERLTSVSGGANRFWRNWTGPLGPKLGGISFQRGSWGFCLKSCSLSSLESCLASETFFERELRGSTNVSETTDRSWRNLTDPKKGGTFKRGSWRVCLKSGSASMCSVCETLFGKGFEIISHNLARRSLSTR